MLCIAVHIASRLKDRFSARATINIVSPSISTVNESCGNFFEHLVPYIARLNGRNSQLAKSGWQMAAIFDAVLQVGVGLSAVALQ